MPPCGVGDQDDRKELAVSETTDPFRMRDPDEAAREVKPQIHVCGPGAVCDTETRGHATPGNRSPLEIVVDATEGFIPLWAKDTTLRWRFQERSIRLFKDPEAAKAAITELLGETLLAWGDAMTVRFSQRDDAWDFEIAVRKRDRCDVNGCVLASAFFPDAGQHELKVYPQMFAQSRKEQIDTLAHELGHVFGLRHFFADVRETTWPSEVFGTHSPFSIMNYGNQSEMTDDDGADLKRLYQSAWSGELKDINGTPIRFVKPFSASGVPAKDLVAVDGVMAHEAMATALVMGR
jgi:hypothetical protein